MAQKTAVELVIFFFCSSRRVIDNLFYFFDVYLEFIDIIVNTYFGQVLSRIHETKLEEIKIFASRVKFCKWRIRALIIELS